MVRAPDSRSADRGFDSRPRHCRATSLGKLFTKQYKLVPCEGFRVNAPYVAANGMGPVNKGSIVVSGLAAILIA